MARKNTGSGKENPRREFTQTTKTKREKDFGPEVSLCWAWPVVCKGVPGGAKAVRAILEQEREQIWAEALAMYNELRHDKRALERALQMDTPELRAAAEKAQNAAARRWRS